MLVREKSGSVFGPELKALTTKHSQVIHISFPFGVTWVNASELTERDTEILMSAFLLKSIMTIIVKQKIK